MIYLEQNSQAYNNDLRVMLLAFYKGEKIIDAYSIEKKPELKNKINMKLAACFEADSVTLSIYDMTEGCDAVCTDVRSITCDTADRENARSPIKRLLYEMLEKRTGKTLKWGTLTGVRPSKIAMKYIEQGYDDTAVKNIYKDIYLAEEEKAELCIRVAHREKELLRSIDEQNGYCLYIGIPFCPSRCLYCSFTSYPVDKYEKRIDEYITALEKELEFVAEKYAKKKLLSVYIGGGTPSSVRACQLDRILGAVDRLFPLTESVEYTVEAGRPDSITPDKLRVIKEHGVSRISINPQTMNRTTLAVIGRKHTPEDVTRVMDVARNMGFDNINMDIIAGLPGENLDMVKHTADCIRQMKPESLTVHSLAIKRAAELSANMDVYRDRLDETDIDSQLSLIAQTASDMSLEPYYLYRQKNIAGNLENVGYAKKGLECIYNILIMEERTDIIGVGAGSSCKLVRGTRIDRLENVKNVDEYIDRIDEMLIRKSRIGARP